MTHVRADFDADGPLLDLLEAGVEAGAFPGAVAAVGSSSGIDRLVAVGVTDPERGVEMATHTIFDCASLTKPVVTATVLLGLVERGTLALSESLDAWLPELADRERGDVTLGQMLAHTSGLRPYAFSADWESREEAFADLLERDLLDARPGERHEYSCLNYVHLAEVARRATGRSLARLARDLVFDPVGMADARMGPLGDARRGPPDEARGEPPDSDVRVAPTYDREYRNRTLRGEIHDPIAWKLGGESGNAGLFASGPDLARFARALLRADGCPLAPATVAALSADRTPEGEEAHGLGWRLARDCWPSMGWSDRALGHTGYTGTSLWLDPKRDRFGVLLTNEVYSGKDGAIAGVRERFHGIVASERY